MVEPELNARIIVLERQNRSLRLLCLVATFVSTAALILSATISFRHTIQASQFLLKDSAGTVRGSLDVTNLQGAGLHLNDATGKEVVSIGAPANGALIALAAANARIAIADDNDRIIWSAPISHQPVSELKPCPANDPAGLFVKESCAPLPPKNK